MRLRQLETTKMMALKEIARHYTALNASIPLRRLRNEKDYKKAISALNDLMDAGVANENHPLSDLLGLLGELVGAYEDARLRRQHATPADVLRLLMDQHGITQSGLPEIGSQGVVSELLAGKRNLNVRQVQKLAKRFSVSPAVFLPD
jgi:HTH-type transcriptional regulator / antitoxin HigA